MQGNGKLCSGKREYLYICWDIKYLIWNYKLKKTLDIQRWTLHFHLANKAGASCRPTISTYKNKNKNIYTIKSQLSNRYFSAVYINIDVTKIVKSREKLITSENPNGVELCRYDYGHKDSRFQRAWHFEKHNNLSSRFQWELQPSRCWAPIVCANSVARPPVPLLCTNRTHSKAGMPRYSTDSSLGLEPSLSSRNCMMLGVCSTRTAPTTIKFIYNFFSFVKMRDTYVKAINN